MAALINSIFSTPPKSKQSVGCEDCTLPPLSDTFDPSQLVVTSLPENITRNMNFGIVIDNVLTPEECNAWIAATEAAGYGTALVNVGHGRQVQDTDYRNSDRCIVDSEEAAMQIFNRISHLIPQTKDVQMYPRRKKWYLEGVNERLRFLRYDPGMFFAPHCDGCYIRSGTDARRPGDTSYVTIQVYLNGGAGVLEGGTTRFFESPRLSFDRPAGHYDVVPKPGSVLLFDHDMKHSGELVTKGRKYAIRSDIMYTMRPPAAAATDSTTA